MTTLPAVVRIIDLPAYTSPLTGGELMEAIQTVGGTTISVQMPASAIMTTGLGALPTGGGTGQILNKASGANFSTTWSGISSFVTVGNSLATSGSVTALVVGLATNVLVSGTIGALGTASFSGGIVATGTINAVGTSQFTGAFNVVGTAVVTGSFGNIGTSIFTGSHGIVGTALVTGLLAASGTAQLLASLGMIAGGTAALLISTTAGFGIYCGTGVPSVSAATGSLYIRIDGATATTRMYVNNSGTGTWTGVTTVA